MSLWKPNEYILFADDKEKKAKQTRTSATLTRHITLEPKVHAAIHILKVQSHCETWDEFFQKLWKNRTVVVTALNGELNLELEGK